MALIYVDTTNTIPAVADLDSIVFVRGGVNVDTNLDHSALTEGVTNILVSKDFFGNIGTPSSSLLADVDGAATGKFRYQGNGACWYTPSGDNDLANLVQNVGRGTLTINGTGTVTELQSGLGQTVVGGNITATNIRLSGGNVDVQSTSGAAVTTIEQTGGFLKMARGCTTFSIYGGATTIEAGTNAITTINYAGGNLFLAQSGTITTLNIIAGNANAIRISRGITITNTVVWGSVPGASALLDQTALITFTNAPTWRIDTGNNYGN